MKSKFLLYKQNKTLGEDCYWEKIKFFFVPWYCMLALLYSMTTPIY